MAGRASTPPVSIFQLKVSLDEIEPPIWRRVLVEGSTTFAGLHRVLQEALGWEDYHLHMFRIGDRLIGLPSDEWSGDLQPDDERKLRLTKNLPEVGATFRYEYDFGDSWTHTILVERIEARDPRFAYPICVAGARACPPEDCGGTWGYMEFIQKMSDPRHPEHDDAASWIGGVFDPEGFDLNRVNRALHALKR